MHKKGNKVIYLFVSDTRDTSSVGIAMHHLNFPRRKDAYGSRLRNPEYRNKLFRSEVDAGAACRRGAAVTSLRHGGEESSAASQT
jgi:hypothetical protein